ncbi:hypothetical protein GCM10022239_02540 [Leifsonia bigeumensis]|uniref:OLD protein-like TOPRIM domain-containing protein n=1 Tax=Leifsonella bigeumensis TaxID=433643 RepID=A0ABP7F6M2_9MICO
MTRFREAVIDEASRGTPVSLSPLRSLARDAGVTTAILVEGVSDQAALETLAARRARDLEAEGVCIVPLGGATSIRRFLERLGPHGLDLRLLGLCDVGEERYFRRGLELAGVGRELGARDLEALGFFVCDADLEAELIRALGSDGVERVIEAEGDLRALRSLQRQPAQRARTREEQLHRFMGSIGGRKARYASALINAAEPGRIPRPLDRLLASLRTESGA